MAVAIGICIIGFIWIYVRVGPLFSDFIPAKSAAITPVTSLLGSGTPTGSGTPLAGIAITSLTPTSAPTVSAAAATPVWQATNKIVAGEDVNFRDGPSTATAVIKVLTSGTQLKFIGQQQQTGGVTWMKFQLQDGTQGWVRNVDVEPVVP